MKLGKPITPPTNWRERYGSVIEAFVQSDEKLRTFPPIAHIDSLYEMLGMILASDRKLPKKSRRFVGVHRFRYNGKIYLMKEDGTKTKRGN